MKQIIVHCAEDNTKVALMENRKLVEYYVESSSGQSVAGNIYVGRVVNVLPGMQAAFVDIGLSKNAFLYIDDLLPAGPEKQPKAKPPIDRLIREGQEIMVQVIKEPSGTKGARVTTHYSLPGRWVVYMPTARYTGISRKIAAAEERERLQSLAEQMLRSGEGMVVRTAAEGESREAIERDLGFLRNLWSGIHARIGTGPIPACVYQDLDIIPRLVRDIFNDEVDELVIDDQAQGEEVIRLLERISPKLADRVKIYSEALPQDLYNGVQEELEKAFRSKIWLRSGGYLFLDQTEALTVFDVNTGKFIGMDSLENTVFQTNLEAAEEIARLIRLRDLGGIIIVDFIDMDDEQNRNRIANYMQNAMARDRTKSIVVGWTKLGLLEITRKKIRNRMDSLFFESCPGCGGTGRVFSHAHPMNSHFMPSNAHF